MLDVMLGCDAHMPSAIFQLMFHFERGVLTLIAQVLHAFVDAVGHAIEHGFCFGQYLVDRVGEVSAKRLNFLMGGFLIGHEGLYSE